MPRFQLTTSFTTGQLLVARFRSLPDRKTVDEGTMTEEPATTYSIDDQAFSPASAFSVEVRSISGPHTSGSFDASNTIVLAEQPYLPTYLDVPTSPYFTWDQFVNRFGYSNIVKASQKDTTQAGPTALEPIPKGMPNWYAVQDSINYATDKISNILYGGVLKVPLDFTPNGGVVPLRVGRWAMIIAFCDLFNMREPDRVQVRNIKGVGRTFGSIYSTELDEALTDIALHKDGIMRAMPEAVHIRGADVNIVQFYDVTPLFGDVRFIDGKFTFYNPCGCHCTH